MSKIEKTIEWMAHQIELMRLHKDDDKRLMGLRFDLAAVNVRLGGLIIDRSKLRLEDENPYPRN